MRQLQALTANKNNQLLLKLNNILNDQAMKVNQVRQDLQIFETNFQLNHAYTREELAKLSDQLSTMAKTQQLIVNVQLDSSLRVMRRYLRPSS